MSRDLLIILRTCTKVHAVSTQKRYITVSKQELVNQCVSSLVTSINNVKDHTVKLVVLDDHSSPEAIEDIKRILSKCKFSTEFIAVEDGTGPSHTCFRVFDQVERQAKDLWYHVEDDYLHFPSAIQDMIDTVDQFEGNTERMIAINPHDDIWRYTRQIYDSILLLGPYRHYRTVVHTTYTCLASKAIYDKYKKHFQDAAQYITKVSEDGTINQVWQKPDVMLFSPIPGLALHIMDEDGKDPYIDFDLLWNSVPKLWID